MEDWENVTYIVYQLERCPETRRLHYQGYVLWKTKKTLSYCKTQHATAHWEPRRGTHEQARDYCKKKDSQVSQDYVFEYGDEPKPGARNDQLAVKAAVDEGVPLLQLWEEHFPVMLKYQRSVSIYRELKTPPRDFKSEVCVMYGKSGTGKSRYIYENLPVDETFWLTPSRDTGDPWYDGYDPLQHYHIILDDFYGWMKFSVFLRLTDRYPMKVPSKGKMVEWRPKMIWITSNSAPLDWYSKVFSNGTKTYQFLRRINVIRRYIALNEYVEERNKFDDDSDDDEETKNN